MIINVSWLNFCNFNSSEFLKFLPISIFHKRRIILKFNFIIVLKTVHHRQTIHVEICACSFERGE